MSSLTPKKGLTVIHRGVVSNGENEHPAIVTRVWSDTEINGEQCTLVNLTVFPDLMTAQHLGSVYLFRSREEGQRAFPSGQYAFFDRD